MDSSSTVILSGSSTSSGLSTRSSSSVPDSSVPGIVHQDLQLDHNYVCQSENGFF